MRTRPDRRLPAAAVVGLSYACGSIPFSGLAARLVAGVDLRVTGTGTVSGSGLYEVAGFGPMALAGGLDLAKGAVGPLLAGRGRPVLAAVSAGATVAAHNWSPWLRGAGGRGVSVALGATVVSAPEATAVLATGLAVGRLVRQTGLGCFVALVVMTGLLARRRGVRGAVLGASIALPMLAKRLAGNHPPASEGRGRVLLSRLLFDRDPAPARAAA